MTIERPCTFFLALPALEWPRDGADDAGESLSERESPEDECEPALFGGSSTDGVIEGTGTRWVEPLRGANAVGEEVITTLEEIMGMGGGGDRSLLPLNNLMKPLFFLTRDFAPTPFMEPWSDSVVVPSEYTGK